MKKVALTVELIFLLLIVSTVVIGTASSAPPMPTYPIPTGPLKPLTINMVSPTTTTYVSWFVPLRLAVTGAWDGYIDHCTVSFSIDDGERQIIYSSRFRVNRIAQDFAVTIGPLSEGSHRLQIFATIGGSYKTSTGTIVLGSNDVTSQESLFFKVNTANQAQIQILSPKNETYSVNQKIPVEFTVSHDTTIETLGYSIDGKSDVIIPRNATMVGTLADGAHTLEVFSEFNDIMAVSSIVNFTVDTTPPDVQILSVQDETYDSSRIPLVFNVNETTSLITYIMDNKVYTVNGNSTISIQQNGEHTLTVYATDDVGNVGVSKTVDFDVVVTLTPDMAYGVLPPLAIVLIGGLSLMIIKEWRKQQAVKAHRAQLP